jgi:hypothetical protein
MAYAACTHPDRGHWQKVLSLVRAISQLAEASSQRPDVDFRSTDTEVCQATGPLDVSSTSRVVPDQLFASIANARGRTLWVETDASLCAGVGGGAQVHPPPPGGAPPPTPPTRTHKNKTTGR